MALARTASFPADPAQLAGLRRFGATAADELGSAVDRADLAVVIGELTANAMLHAGGESTLTLTALDDGTLLVEVCDGADAPPQVVRDGSWDATGHRGMAIVEALSHSWGTESTSHGKRVWARLAPTPVSPRSAARPG